MPAELRLLKDETIRAWNAKGKMIYGGTDNEQSSKVFRQSIWPTRNIRAGEMFSSDNIKICRPGLSLEPKYYKQLFAKTAKRDILFADKIFFSDISDN
jgi:sialic acid synthase SpsE